MKIKINTMDDSKSWTIILILPFETV